MITWADHASKGRRSRSDHSACAEEATSERSSAVGARVSTVPPPSRGLVGGGASVRNRLVLLGGPLGVALPPAFSSSSPASVVVASESAVSVGSSSAAAAAAASSTAASSAFLSLPDLRLKLCLILCRMDFPLPFLEERMMDEE